nr:nitrilase-related carbon-nitrogen hydrolase [Neobacillus bataviensis]
MAGHSLISDPWGEVLAEAGEQQEILTAEINLDLVKKIQQANSNF